MAPALTAEMQTFNIANLNVVMEFEKITSQHRTNCNISSSLLENIDYKLFNKKEQQIFLMTSCVTRFSLFCFFF